jgi:hypothetical protein
LRRFFVGRLGLSDLGGGGSLLGRGLFDGGDLIQGGVGCFDFCLSWSRLLFVSLLLVFVHR